MDAETALKILSFAIGLAGGAGSAAWAGVRWYGAQERARERMKAAAEMKEYAAQRDFAHLRNNHEQLSTAINQIAEELEQLSLKMVRLEFAILDNKRLKPDKED